MRRSGRVRVVGLFSEGCLNVATGTSRPFLVVLLLLAVPGSLALFNVHTMAAEFEIREQLVEEGATSVEVFAPGRVSAPECLATGSDMNVLGAVAIRTVQEQSLAQAPDSPFTVLGAAGDLGYLADLGVAQLSTAAADRGVLVGQSLVDEFDLKVGAPVVADTSGPLAMSGAVALGRWHGELARVAVVPVPQVGVFDRCIVTYAELGAADVETVWVALMPGSNDGVRVGQVNREFGTAGMLYDVEASVLSLGEAALVAVAAVGCSTLLFRRRRVEFAFLLCGGWSRVSIGAVAAVEAWVLGLAASAMLIPPVLLMVVGASGAEDRRALAGTGVLLLCTIVAAAAVGAAVAAVTLRYGHVHRYLRDRSG